MGNPVALATAWELVQNRLRMGGGMTGKTRWHGLVLVLVAKDTSHIVMLCLVLRQQAQGLVMTGSAIMIGCILPIFDNERHVDRMARDTGLEIHVLRVFFVTLGTVGNLLVDGMAFITGHIRMSAGMGLDLIALLLVAGQTGSHKFALQFQIQRSVRIGMAAATILQIIVGFPAVAHVTPRNSVSALGRMFHMAVHAPHLGFVFLPTVRDGDRLLRMAVHALRIEQGRNLRRNNVSGRCCLLRLLSRSCWGLYPCRLLTGKDTDQRDDSKNASDANCSLHSRQPTE